MIGAYADRTRTVVFVDVDGRGLFNPDAPDEGETGPVVEVVRLVDKSGKVYPTSPYVGVGGHSVSIPFEPIAGMQPGQVVQLTLHVSRLMEASGEWIAGNWKIPFEVTIATSLELPVPPRADVGGDRFTLTAATLSGRLLTVRWEVTGPSVEEVRRLAYSAAAPDTHASNQPALVALTRSLSTVLRSATAEGPAVLVLTTGGTFPTDGPAVAEMQALVPEPGEYVLTLRESGSTLAILTVR